MLEVVWMDTHSTNAFGGQHNAAAASLSRDPSLHFLLAGLLGRMAGGPAQGSLPGTWLQMDLQQPFTRLVPAACLPAMEAAMPATEGAACSSACSTVACLPVMLQLSRAAAVPAVLMESSLHPGGHHGHGGHGGHGADAPGNRLALLLSSQPACMSAFACNGDCVYQVRAACGMRHAL